MVRILICLAVLCGSCFAGCSGGPAGAPDPPDGPAPRSYLMGWAPTPPRGTTESIIATAQAMAEVSELALVQVTVPWTRVLAGEPIDDLVEETGMLADFLGALGLDLVVLVDPLDGLDRRREPPELVAAGRSIREPAIRALHDEYTLALAARTRPRWLGLASEINTLGAHGDPDLYTAMVDLVNDLAPQVRAAAPGAQVFVSFQVDDAWGFGPPSAVDHFALIDDFDVDALGLSTYPVFVFDTPAAIPDDYFARFDRATDRPLLLVEGGWSSAMVGNASGTPAEQADFFRRFADLLDGVDGRAWVMLFYADLDLASYGLPPDREAGLSPFSRMGIVDVDLQPKPAFAVWREIFDRPVAP